MTQMTIKQLYEELKQIVDLGGGDDLVFIVNRFSIPDDPKSDAVAEVEQKLETVEPGDGMEHIFLMGEMDS